MTRCTLLKVRKTAQAFVLMFTMTSMSESEAVMYLQPCAVVWALAMYALGTLQQSSPDNSKQPAVHTLL